MVKMGSENCFPEARIHDSEMIITYWWEDYKRKKISLSLFSCVILFFNKLIAMVLYISSFFFVQAILSV